MLRTARQVIDYLIYHRVNDRPGQVTSAGDQISKNRKYERPSQKNVLDLDSVNLASSACGLQEMVNRMNDSVKKRGVKMNFGKTKVMVFERGESTTECDLLIEGEKVEQVKEFVYLDSLFTNDGKYDRDVERRVNAGIKVNGALFSIINSKNV
ncbi:hypothetical protein EVAR_67931_1 [Eumeta japonica]|uniref:Reverse transcriptase domain-containing protein n=1 Tax=Eumeta variegata TaxID=151549 RepID=A0A4C1ZRB6_EUMVA|nr:hypothetical protein EVAR_67931_1 [Eumeta japonica]